ncbi:MAG: ribbon-helix-helix protein, CopG family [Candidatus Xenobia bacterium]
MKSIVLPGQKTKASCDTCKAFRQATWGLHSHTLEDGTEVENVMQAQCDTCGSLIAIAGQAVHRIKGAIKDREKHRTSVRLPQELLDFMGARLNAAGADPTDFDMFLRALFVAAHEAEKRLFEKLPRVEDLVLERPATALINITVSPQVADLLKRFRAATGQSTSEVLRRLLVLADGDLAAAVDEHLKREAYVTA